jgi:hypothetical protein
MQVRFSLRRKVQKWTKLHVRFHMLFEQFLIY